jgi:AcrR family transcriptional regulator
MTVAQATKQNRTMTALLEAAAAVFAEQGAQARLADVAAAAGVGPATLYRYFSDREALLSALFEYALHETSESLVAADLDNVPVREGIARAARALVAMHNKYSVLSRMVDQVDKEKVDQCLREPIVALLRRGRDEGTLRTDLSEDETVAVLAALLQAATQLAIQGHAGVERAATLATSMFLDGTACRDP